MGSELPGANDKAGLLVAQGELLNQRTPIE